VNQVSDGERAAPVAPQGPVSGGRDASVRLTQASRTQAARAAGRRRRDEGPVPMAPEVLGRLPHSVVIEFDPPQHVAPAIPASGQTRLKGRVGWAPVVRRVSRRVRRWRGDPGESPSAGTGATDDSIGH
jgi:hypothetical protein